MSDDSVTNATALGWAAAILSGLVAALMGLFSRTNASAHKDIAALIKDHEERIRALCSETNDAQVTADRAISLFTSAVETSHLFNKNTVTELTAVIQLSSERNRAMMDLHAANTERKIDAIQSQLDHAGLKRHRPNLYQDDGA